MQTCNKHKGLPNTVGNEQNQHKLSPCYSDSGIQRVYSGKEVSERQPAPLLGQRSEISILGAALFLDRLPVQCQHQSQAEVVDWIGGCS